MIVKRLKNKIYRLKIDFLFALGIENLIIDYKKGAAILCYHGVDLKSSKILNMRFYSKDSLEKPIILKNILILFQIED